MPVTPIHNPRPGPGLARGVRPSSSRFSAQWLALVFLTLGSLRAGQEPTLQEPPLVEAIVTSVRTLRRGINKDSPRYLEVRDGWLSKQSIQLFQVLNPELFPPKKNAKADPLRAPIEVILDTQRQLALEGVELLVVPIPTRLNIYPEVLAELQLGKDFEGFAPGLAKLNERLRGAGVEVLDLLPHFTRARAGWDRAADDQVFLRVNGHWSPKGAAIAAAALADNIRSRPWFAQRTAVPPGNSRLETHRAVWTAPDIELPEGVAPPILSFERALSASGEPLQRSDRTSPIVLWGDSFSTIFEAEAADLPRRLHHEVGLPVDVIASSGGGPHTSRSAFSRRHNPMDGKRLVIWTFASRTLLAGKWEPVVLVRR